MTLAKSDPPTKPSKSRRRGIVLATPRYKIHFADPAARRWLKEFFGGRARTRVLPDKVRRWLAKKGEPKAPKSLAAKRGDARLYLKRQNLYTPHLIGLLLELITRNGKGWPREHTGEIECRDRSNPRNYDGDCRKTSRTDLSEARGREQDCRGQFHFRTDRQHAVSNARRNFCAKNRRWQIRLTTENRFRPPGKLLSQGG